MDLEDQKWATYQLKPSEAGSSDLDDDFLLVQRSSPTKDD